MKLAAIIISLGVITFFSCDPEPTGPEMNCQLFPTYKLGYHGVKASKAYDVRSDPPEEIKKGTLKYKLGNQLLTRFNDDPVPFPYLEYFIDSIVFLDETTAEVFYFEQNFSRLFEVTRNDCQLDLNSPEGNIHLELTNSGEEISEKRYAIYDHQSMRVTIDQHSFISDSFSFLEFRLGPFTSYDEIIKQFALDHPGEFDTIAIELVENRTKD